MPNVFEGKISGEGKRFAVIVSRFNDFISHRLVNGALDALGRHGADDENIDVVKVPGCFEIPFMAKKMAQSGRYNAVICLGAVIRGSTPHFEYISVQVSRGIASAGVESGIPVIFGVITADTLEQAIERAGSKAGNKGWDAAVAAMEMANLMDSVPTYT
ncbi:MAG: 6,7-dimethyl-8-ribityllumazine synthase [Deltaproteobacteria bacterium]|nr:6,7-dimethyl-8-ribityllumazine synthase [Deltaproteobacteria bacterium]RLB96449.1 MAG: 6,7-dimethyl-8-ribityllumazine synthase [Deltaproteobacteria bacterium]RLC12375.1 MAG: 6,7-dimethyl-8-ribityllumazine synthase [Deltaproteobacteria bacterium]